MIKTILHFTLQVSVLLGLGLYAFGFDYSLGWYLFYFYLLFCFVNWFMWLMPAVLLSFSLKQTVAHVQTQEQLPIVFDRRLFLDPYLSFNGKTISLNKNEELYLPVFFKHRGIVDSLPLTLEISDLTGKLQRKKTYVLKEKVLVLPKPDFEYSQNLYTFLMKNRLLYEKDHFSSEIADHRNYQYGDPLNRINWKLSARTEDLITRELLPEENQPVLVILWSDSEELINLYYSFYQQHKNDFHFLIWSKSGVLSQHITPEEWAVYQQGPPAGALPKNRQILLFSERNETTAPSITFLQQHNSVTLIEHQEMLQIHGKKQSWTLPKAVNTDD